MKRIVVRSLLTAALPVILLYAFFVELITEIGNAFYRAWLEVRANIDAYRREMKRTDY